MASTASPAPREALELPESYWQSKRSSPAQRRSSSEDRFAWILVITAIVMIALGQYHRFHAFTWGWP
jgi:hypothetical protein